MVISYKYLLCGATIINYLILCTMFQFATQVAAKGGGKRTYGSKSQSTSQTQNLDCTDQSCIDSTSWTSVLGATLALVGPLMILLTLILVLKLCYARLHPNLLDMNTTQMEPD